MAWFATNTPGSALTVIITQSKHYSLLAEGWLKESKHPESGTSHSLLCNGKREGLGHISSHTRA